MTKRNQDAFTNPSEELRKEYGEREEVRDHSEGAGRGRKSSEANGRRERERGTAGTTPRSSKLIHQIIPFVWYLVALLVTISMINPSWLGVFGIGVHWFLFGLFGYGAFAFPLWFIFLGYHWQRLMDRKTSPGRLLLGIGIIIGISALLTVCIEAGKEMTANPVQLFKNGNAIRGGGFFGGLWAFVLYKIFNLVGSIIIDSAMTLVLAMFFLGLTPAYIVASVKERRKKAAAAPKSAEEPEEKPVRPAGKTKAEGPSYLSPSDSWINSEESESKGEDDGEYSQVRTVRKGAVPMPEETFDNEEDGEEDLPGSDAIRAGRQSGRFTYDQMLEEDGSDEEVPAGIANPVGVLMKDSAKEEPEEPVEVSMTRKEKAALKAIPLEDTTVRNVGETMMTPSVDKRDVKKVVLEENEEDYEMAGDKKSQTKSRKATAISDNVQDYEGLEDEEENEEIPLEEEPEKEGNPYVYPPIDLLEKASSYEGISESVLLENVNRLETTLASFHIPVREITYSCGPTITRYEVKPEAGIRVRTIANLVDDISMSMGVSGIRIEAPIPGKTAVGIEVPNPVSSTVYLRSMIDSQKFRESKSKITACLGTDVVGNPVLFDIAKMPHLLIAGTTGSGKSVCINCIIMSLLYKSTPREVKLLLIDPKKVEFNVYKGIPHLYSPIVSDPKKAAAALMGAVNEMERRFELIEEVGVRNLSHYNAAIADDPDKEELPYLVIIIDELADLMMTARDEVEKSICRLAQKGRAAGIDLIVGTQRPSVDVITGLIKANVPSRIAFTVVSQVDSRTIIDIAGAEKLIGRGDMLFAPVGSPKPARVQGAFVSDTEVENVSNFVREHNDAARYDEKFVAEMEKEAQRIGVSKKDHGGDFGDGSDADIRDEDEERRFWQAVEFAVDAGKVATSYLQRKMSVGYGKAAKMIDRMESLGIVSAPDGTKPREVLITRDELAEMRTRGTGSEE